MVFELIAVKVYKTAKSGNVALTSTPKGAANDAQLNKADTVTKFGWRPFKEAMELVAPAGIKGLSKRSTSYKGKPTSFNSHTSLS